MWTNNLPKALAVEGLARALKERPTVILAAVIARCCGQDVLPFVNGALQGIEDLEYAEMQDVERAMEEAAFYLDNGPLRTFIRTFRHTEQT